MKFLSSSVMAIVLFSLAGCATQTTEHTATTTRTSQRTSATDTTALDPSRNSNMQSPMYEPMARHQ